MATRHHLPDKLKLRDHLMRRERDPLQQEPARSVNSYVICKDGRIIPIEDEALLALIEERNLPSRP